MFMKVVALLAALAAMPLALGSLQAIRVTGKVLCGEKPYSNGTGVKLIEKEPVNDDTLDKKKVSDDGTFTLQGQDKEHTNIDPELHIYTYCGDEHSLCPRRWKVKIPKSYIYEPKGKGGEKTFNIGSVNLEMILHDEDHDCFH